MTGLARYLLAKTTLAQIGASAVFFFLGLVAVGPAGQASETPSVKVAAGAGARLLSLFPRGVHCVGYRTHKRLFLVFPVTVVGKSCEVSAQVIPELEDRFLIDLNFPISSLASGESERDRDVAQILKADVQPDVRFHTVAMTADEWKALARKDHFQLPGELVIGGEKFPIKAEILLVHAPQGIEIDGIVKGSFSDYKISPPAMAAGLMAKVKDDLELHFHLLAFKTLGIDSIL